MFEPLPEADQHFALTSFDAVHLCNVQAALEEALVANDRAQKAYAAALASFEGSDDSDLADGYALHESDDAYQAAMIKKVQAVLLTAIYIEGTVNALGVLTFGSGFFKAHVERVQLESKLALMIVQWSRRAIDANHPANVAMRKVFERRNQIAHRKTKDMSELLASQDPQKIRRAVEGRKSVEDVVMCQDAIDGFADLVRSEFPDSAQILL
jgi:hypothetical protein